MRFLYLAPRYHTNQAPIMKCLIENGHEVCFLSHYRGGIEDYSVISPVILGYSGLFRLWERFYVKVLQRNNSRAVDMKLKFGFPPVGKVRKQVKEFAPDVMIIRERSVYSMISYLACKNLHIPSILYNQSPLWEKEIKNDLPHKLVKAALPKIRMTPVLGMEGKGREKEEGAVFIPFVIEPKLKPEEKQWFQDGNINILCIGKYEKRKNIRMLLEVFEELQKQYDLTLTVAGECTSKFHKEYKAQQDAFVEEHRLQNKVKLLQNLARDEVEELYSGADLFIIPSTDEPASVSQMEAMAFSVPAICSNENGTACYVRDGKSGCLFQDNQKQALREAVIKMISDKEKLKEMGKNSYAEIENGCSFSRYYESVLACIEKAKKQKKG